MYNYYYYIIIIIYILHVYIIIHIYRSLVENEGVVRNKVTQAQEQLEELRDTHK